MRNRNDPLACEAWSPDKRAGVALLDGDVAAVMIRLAPGQRTDLHQLGDDIRRAYTTVIAEFAQRAGTVDTGQTHDQTPPVGTIQDARRVLERFATEALADASATDPEIPDDVVTIVSATGCRLRYARGALVGVELDGEVANWPTAQLETTVKDSLLRGQAAAKDLEFDPAQPATQAELDQLLTRIQNLRVGHLS